MLTLCIDTAYRYLSVALVNDDGVVACEEFECFKKQSEQLFVSLDSLFKKSGIDKLAIDSVCVTSGPGSYTGVRIGITLAKVLAQTAGVGLYTISTLRLYAANEKNTMVLMDARANRAYVGVYDGADVLLSDCAMELDKIDLKNYRVVGDGHLFDKDDYMPSIAEAFYRTKALWKKTDNIAYLVPDYLKESDQYYR